MRYSRLLPNLLIAVLAGSSLLTAGSIVEISIPVNSNDATSHPFTSGVWSVSAPPFPLAAIGIGHIIGPMLAPGDPLDLALHDHVYLSPNVPDPARAIVTYRFDSPTIVSALDILQHYNGINSIEGFYGDSLGSMTSLGTVIGSLGLGPFTDLTHSIFNFGNTTNAGLYFQFVIRSTPLEDGYAMWRANPLDAKGVAVQAATTESPEPGTLGLIGAALVLGAFRYRRS